MPGLCPVSFSKLRIQLIDTAAASVSNPRFLRRILARAVTSGLWHDPFVAARLIAYCADSDVTLANLAFFSSPRPTAFAFTAMIRAHSSSHTPVLSLLFFRRMLRSDLFPDRFAFPFLLRAASRCGASSSAIHGLVLRHGLEKEPHVATSLLHAYAFGGLIECAFMVFDEMPVRTVVTWNAVISCCSKSVFHYEGLSFFTELLLSQDVCMNADTLIAALSCCTGVGALAQGKSVHALAVRYLGNPSAEVGASLVHMYVKCGSLENGKKVFDRMFDRDTSAWTAMIGGLAMHGQGHEAVALFQNMIANGVRPDSLSFTSVLHACSHCGLVDMGVSIFNDMKEKYKVELKVEHFGAMVDLYARAGRLKEAERLIEVMPFRPNREVWGSLLNARATNDKEDGEEEEEKGRLEVYMKFGFCVGISNVYAREGRWEEVGKVRAKMVEEGVRKEKGFSLVEVGGRVHRFLVGDTRHPLTFEIYKMLNQVMYEKLYV